MCQSYSNWVVILIICNLGFRPPPFFAHFNSLAVNIRKTGKARTLREGRRAWGRRLESWHVIF